MSMPVIIFGAPIEIAGEQFEELSVIDAAAAAIRWPRHLGKALLGLRPRWHMVERQKQYDTPVYSAREIVLHQAHGARINVTLEMREPVAPLA